MFSVLRKRRDDQAALRYGVVYNKRLHLPEQSRSNGRVPGLL
jgi:hypothetical protein